MWSEVQDNSGEPGGIPKCILFFIRGIQKIFIRCRNVEEVIRSSVLNFRPGFLHLEVHCFRVKGERIRDIGDVLMGIMENSVGNCLWMYING